MSIEFKPMSKVPRLNRNVVVTEKIDGTNACVVVVPAADFIVEKVTPPPIGFRDDHFILAGSRTRWLTLQEDNHGFAAWVADHLDDLIKLGPGRHFGEWWGHGINRGYGLPKGDRRFSLFNVVRWAVPGIPYKQDGDPDTFLIRGDETPPACCSVVPMLGGCNLLDLDELLEVVVGGLGIVGSMAAPGYMNPEGVIVYHHAADQMFKYTFDGDGHKGARR